MSRILKPYTIIPPELYIERDADRQVDNIIRDMERPGYVLVSRQMGKTNLLLNAKRRLENTDDIFVYIDLSNSFEELKSCFENIIDTILDTNEEKLFAILETIKNNRNQQKDIPPFKQHIKELCLILKHINGKLVIILDEIDALTKRDFSDQVFAQIRSIYFSRANYSELKRLTYILSGVVEPNEIIKDPKISPFNIGEKIFLNDFSKEEFESFITKSKLILSQEIIDRIYFWTAGNPRITWDICSEIENKFTNKQINTKDIDELISEMYFTAFDRSPVDNIRELVEKDRELRNALIEIAYKKGKEVSDKIKSKLYLAGITNYNGDNDIHIKNEIIRQSLSIDWIRKIEEEDKGLINLALEYCGKENFSEALSCFERYLEDNSFDKEAESSCYHEMGRAAYRISNFEKSIKYLNLAKFDKKDMSKLYYLTLNLKGLSFYYLKDFNSSLTCFKEIIDSDRKDEIYIRALFNYGSISLKSKESQYQIESLKIFKDVTKEVGFDKDSLEQDFIDEIKSIAYYNIAQIQSSENNIDDAIVCYDNALTLSKSETTPIILLGLYEVINSLEEKQKILKQIVDVITHDKIKPIVDDPDKPMCFNLYHLKIVIILIYLHLESEFDKIKPWLSHLGERSLSTHLYELSLFSINSENNWDTAIALLNKIYDNFNNDEYNADESVRYNTLKILAFTDSKKSEKYISLFSQNRVEQIDYLDFSIFADLIATLVDQRRYNESLKYIQIINSVKNETGKELQINYLVIYHCELNVYCYLNKFEEVREKAKEILELCNDETIKRQKSNLLGDKGLETIKKNAESILYPNRENQQPIRIGKKYGRNDRITVKYNDGKIKNIKYKAVEDDINAGKCEIIEE